MKPSISLGKLPPESAMNFVASRPSGETLELTVLRSCSGISAEVGPAPQSAPSSSESAAMNFVSRCPGASGSGS